MMQIDTARIAEAVGRPGIDPRTFTTLAVVDAVQVTAVGIYCDITTVHGVKETAAYSPMYGGRSFGFHAPIEVGSFVVIAVPEGDWATGARIIAHVWDEGTPPPQVVVDHPADVALVVQPGQSVRIIVSGGGNAVIQAEGGSKVLLGNEAAELGVARKTDPTSVDLNVLQSILDLRYSPLPPAPGVPMTLPAAAQTVATTAGDPKIALGEIGEIAGASETVLST